jgi:hypothetical protein
MEVRFSFLVLICSSPVEAHAHLKGSVFGIVVAVAFQIAFCAEIHVNDIFSFFKNYF